MRSFVKIKSSQNGKNTLSFTDVYKSWQSLEFFKWQMSFNTRSIRKNYSRKKCPNLQYTDISPIT